MPPKAIIDLAAINYDDVKFPKDEVYKVNAHRFEFQMLDGVYFVNHQEGTSAGYRDVRNDEFWVRGHIPGRPLMPGVVMIECAAQLCAFWTMRRQPEMGFVGFAKCDNVRFRGMVTPPSRLYMLAHLTEINRRRAVADCQGLCDGALVFEATITGMSV